MNKDKNWHPLFLSFFFQEKDREFDIKIYNTVCTLQRVTIERKEQYE